jgi:hypothetical protein
VEGGKIMNDKIYGLIYEKWTKASWVCKRIGSDCGSFRVYKTTNGILQHIEFDVVTGWITLLQEELFRQTPITINKHLQKRINWTLKMIDDSND